MQQIHQRPVGAPVIPGEGAEKAAIDKAAKEFEALFLGEMFRHMFSDDPDPVFGGGNSEKVYQSMLIDEYGKAISKSGGIGIADAVTKQLIALQEAQ